MNEQDLHTECSASGLIREMAQFEKVTFFCKPVPPFRLDLSVWVLRRRPENAVDRWDGQTYRRVLAVDGHPFEVAAEQVDDVDAPRVRVTVSGRKVSTNTKAYIARVLERLLGTHTDLRSFYRLAARDKKLGPLARSFRGAKPSRFATVFEALINAIACQQLSLSLGIQLLNRLAETFGLAMSINGVRAYAFPRPQDLAGLKLEDIRRLGLNRQKGRAMIELSTAMVEGQLNLESLEDRPDDEAVELLCGLRGVGRWTAEYVLLRGLGRLHVFPGDDVGTRNLLQRWLRLRKPLDYQGVHRVLAPWHPHAGLVYFHLLMALLDEKGYVTGTPSQRCNLPAHHSSHSSAASPSIMPLLDSNKAGDL